MTQPASIVEAFAPLLPHLAEEEVPLVLAILERIAGEKYRGWAEDSADPFERAGLLACAAREDEIADFIESLSADSQTRVSALHSRFPDLLERYDSVMDGRSRREQLRIQSEGELGGADYMRQFADATAGAISARFASLALCEEANSRFLSELIRD